MDEDIEPTTPSVPSVQSSNQREQVDKTIFERPIQILDGKNIQVGRTNGTSIGTATDQKVGFYGKTTTQYPAIGTPSGGSTVDSQSRTAIASIITALHDAGIIG